MTIARQKTWVLLAISFFTAAFFLLAAPAANAEPYPTGCGSQDARCDSGTATCTGGRTVIIRTQSWGTTAMSITGASKPKFWNDGQVKYFVTGKTSGSWSVWADRVDKYQTYAYCSY